MYRFKKVAVAVIVALSLMVGSVGVANAAPPSPGDNLGSLTSWALHVLGFDQGGHSSDPSGDGHGPGTADEPRTGLANVVEQGNLQATIDLLKALLGL